MSLWAGLTRLTVARWRAFGPASKYSDANLGRNRSGKFPKPSRCLMKALRFSVEYGSCGRRQNAAVAERARSELHAALHPRHDAVFFQLSTAAPMSSGTVARSRKRSLQFSRTCLISAAVNEGPRQ